MQQIDYSLFSNMEQEEINYFIDYSRAKVVNYGKGEYIFNIDDIPSQLYIVIEGEVAICKDTVSGKRTIINTFQSAGEMFGEVFLFMGDINYINYAVTIKDSRILEISKSYFFAFNEVNASIYAKLIHNMLSIISKKAYYLNQKLQLMSGTSLRQRISQALLNKCKEDIEESLDMSREAMADFLGTTRPSLSRELSKMHEEGLIDINGRNIRICNILKLREYI